MQLTAVHKRPSIQGNVSDQVKRGRVARPSFAHLLCVYSNTNRSEPAARLDYISPTHAREMDAAINCPAHRTRQNKARQNQVNFSSISPILFGADLLFTAGERQYPNAQPSLRGSEAPASKLDFRSKRIACEPPIPISGRVTLWPIAISSLATASL